MNAILGTKIDQTQTFNSEGKRIPITHISVAPIWIVDVRTVAKDGYNALRLGFGVRKIKNISKPEQGVFKKAGFDKIQPRFLREIRISSDTSAIKPGISVKASDIFKEGDRVSVTGISKGKGFAGVVKRHHFKGGPRTHGQSDRERAPGSIGQTTTPGRVYKGKRMAGRMGQDQVTIKNINVISVDPAKNILTVSGLVAGGRNSLLLIKKLNSK